MERLKTDSKGSTIGSGQSAERMLPRNTICLMSYRNQLMEQPDLAVGDGLTCANRPAGDRSAQIMLFTGVQIVRDGDGDFQDD